MKIYMSNEQISKLDSSEIYNINEKKKLNEEITKISKDLAIPDNDIDYLKKLNLKNNKTILTGAAELNIDKINNLAKLVSETQTDSIKSKFDLLKKNIIESNINSRIENKIDESNLAKDLMDIVNISLDNVNNYYTDKLIKDEVRCPSRKINPDSLDCNDRKSYMSIHPDKNLSCRSHAKDKFQRFETRCNIQSGGSSKNELYNIAQKISTALNFSPNTNKQFNQFIESFEVPEMSKTFEEIRNMVQSESIDKKIYNYQIGNTRFWSDKTIQKYEDFKKNSATLEILTIINKFKKLAEKEGTIPKDQVDSIIGELLNVINNTFEINNENLKKINFESIENQTGGSNELSNFRNYLKYKKYKEKYLALKKKIH